MLTIGSTPAAVTFEQPLAMLRACHGKILQQCDTLEKLAVHLRQHGNDQQAQQAARGILRYFDTAGQFHHLDEENDLFPAMRASEPAGLAELLRRLLHEHIGMLAAWQAVQTQLQGLVREEPVLLSDEGVADFVSRYRAHVALENAELLPWAAQLLSDEQQTKIGRAMAARRGVAI